MKKAQAFVKNLMYKMFRRKFIVPVEDAQKHLKVWRVNPESDYIIEILGIQPEIKDKIIKTIIDSMKEHEDVVKCMVYISERVTHANEFALAMYLLRVEIERAQSTSIPGLLGMILGSRKRG